MVLRASSVRKARDKPVSGSVRAGGGKRAIVAASGSSTAAGAAGPSGPLASPPSACPKVRTRSSSEAKSPPSRYGSSRYTTGSLLQPCLPAGRLTSKSRRQLRQSALGGGLATSIQETFGD